jgi:mitogen-activated protein kinase kinase 1
MARRIIGPTAGSNAGAVWNTPIDGEEAAPASFKVTSSGHFVQGAFKMNMHGCHVRDDVNSCGHAPSGANAPLSTLSLGQLELGKCLGRGASAVVYLARHKATGQQLALKKLGIHSVEERHVLMAELKALVAVSTPFLVHMYDAFFDGDSVYIALEYMNGASLEQLIQVRGSMPEAVVAVVATHLTQGLQFLAHAQRLHRDLKPSNCLCSRAGFVKISDFGLSRSLSLNVSVAGTFLGTALYMSPERLKGEGYSYSSDVWALGLTVIECITGSPVFSSAADFFALSFAASNEPIVPAGLPADLGHWLFRCLQHDPTQRATASELLMHPWLQKHSQQREYPLRVWIATCSDSSES